MRKLIFISILLIFHSTFDAFNQERDTLGLQKYFWNITPFIGLESETKNSLNQGTQLMTGGLLYKMGNNWRIKERKKSTIFFKLIWLRLGVFPQGLILTPLQVGTGLHHNFNKDHSFEVSMSGGLVISTDDAINPELEYNYLISPEVKINLGRFSIGAEYSLRTFRNIVGTPQYRWHYIGVVIGGRFGRFKSN